MRKKVIKLSSQILHASHHQHQARKKVGNFSGQQLMVMASSFDLKDERAEDLEGSDRSNQPMHSSSSNQEELDSTQEEDMKNISQQKLKPKIEGPNISKKDALEDDTERLNPLSALHRTQNSKSP